jgi:PAS domain S-box-containing protein
MNKRKQKKVPAADRSAQLTQELRETDFLLNQKILQLETLYQAGLNIGSSLEIGQIVDEFLPQAIAMVDARAGFLLRRERAHKQLVLEDHTNLNQEQLALISSEPLMGTLRLLLRTGKARSLAPSQLTGALAGRYLLAVPLGREGVLVVLDKETREGVQDFSEADVHLLELICRQAGVALANARLYRDMEEEKNLNQSIVSSIANGVISTDLRGRIMRVNTAVERIFVAQEKFVGRSCAQLFRQSGCARIAEAVQQALRDGQHRQIDAEGARTGSLSLNAMISSLRDADGQMQGLVITLEDLTEHHRIRSMFKQYASDQVVDLLLAADTQPALGGENREVAMLFVDLVGSTGLLDEIGAEKMVYLLNDCFTRLVDIVFRDNGMLDKYTGDGFLAVYGAPVAFDDDVERAARSAMDIRAEMQRFNRANGIDWGIKIGLSRGVVTVGNVGSLRRMEYTVIGPMVNLGARLCDRARSGQVLVESGVYEVLREKIDFSSEGYQIFKGIREPVEIYQLIGPLGSGARQENSRRELAMKEKPAKVDLDIPMVPDMELTATHTAEAVGHFMGLDEEKIEEVKMALIEACINAIEHSQSKDGRLHIDFDVSDSALTIVISDRGHGFDVGAVREKLRQRRESGQRQRGWGLQLMEELMDRVDLQSDSDGTTLTLVKNR